MGEAGLIVVGHEPLQVFEGACRGAFSAGDDLAVGLCRQDPVGAVGEDLQVDGVGWEIDQTCVPDLGDVGDRSGPDFAAPRESVTTRAFIAFIRLMPDTNLARRANGRPVAGPGSR